MHDEWLRRWDEGNIGFHREQVHPALLQHWPLQRGSVLVPLCGKSLDLRWLAERGHTVVGVELAERAVLDFFREQGIGYERQPGPLPAYVGKELAITIYQGDYFALQGLRCDALYDRAALIALPPKLRPAYAAHTAALLSPGALKLVVSLEYAQPLVQGPPFAVMAAEVTEYWPELTELARCGDELPPPKFRAAGVIPSEVVWRTRL